MQIMMHNNKQLIKWLPLILIYELIKQLINWYQTTVRKQIYVNDPMTIMIIIKVMKMNIMNINNNTYNEHNKDEYFEFNEQYTEYNQYNQ